MRNIIIACVEAEQFAFKKFFLLTPFKLENYYFNIFSYLQERRYNSLHHKTF